MADRLILSRASGHRDEWRVSLGAWSVVILADRPGEALLRAAARSDAPEALREWAAR